MFKICAIWKFVQYRFSNHFLRHRVWMIEIWYGTSTSENAKSLWFMGSCRYKQVVIYLPFDTYIPVCLIWAPHFLPCRVVRWQLWNFSVVQVKFNSFLHFNEPPKRNFWYLVRPFYWRLSKIGYFQFSKSILVAKTQLDLPENDFLFWILN